MGGTQPTEPAPAGSYMLQYIEDPGDDLPPWLTKDDIQYFTQTYEKAGFSHKQAQGLISPYPVEHTLIAGVEGIPVERLTYPKAFKDL